DKFGVPGSFHSFLRFDIQGLDQEMGQFGPLLRGERGHLGFPLLDGHVHDRDPERSHFINPRPAHAPPLAAATTFLAASVRPTAVMIFRPDSSRSFLPRSTFVPSRRTTRGTLKSISS